jgi:zinc finger CCHC domain-containing protein 9
MTRITNFGRKRTYLEAGFGSAGVDEGEQALQGEVSPKPEDEVVNPPKKARKRRRKNADATTAHDEGSIEGSSRKATSGENRKRDEIGTKGMLSWSSACSRSYDPKIFSRT